MTDTTTSYQNAIGDLMSLRAEVEQVFNQILRANVAKSSLTNMIQIAEQSCEKQDSEIHHYDERLATANRMELLLEDSMRNNRNTLR